MGGFFQISDTVETFVQMKSYMERPKAILKIFTIKGFLDPSSWNTHGL